MEACVFSKRTAGRSRWFLPYVTWLGTPIRWSYGFGRCWGPEIERSDWRHFVPIQLRDTRRGGCSTYAQGNEHQQLLRLKQPYDDWKRTRRWCPARSRCPFSTWMVLSASNLIGKCCCLTRYAASLHCCTPWWWFHCCRRPTLSCVNRDRRADRSDQIIWSVKQYLRGSTCQDCTSSRSTPSALFREPRSKGRVQGVECNSWVRLRKRVSNHYPLHWALQFWSSSLRDLQH